MALKNADGSTSNILELTSLVGSQKKKFLNQLPSKLNEYICPDTCATVCKVWTLFKEYNMVSDFILTKHSAGVIYFRKGRNGLNYSAQ